jgi:hypothetical protein
MRSRILFATVGIAAIAAVSAPAAFANHSWNGYHWARTANPFTVKLGNNLTTSEWQSHLSQTSSDWSKSTVLDTTIVAGQARNRNCRPTAGRDEICNASYGNNGWLGVATIWLQSGSSHIVQGTVKVNDYYLGPGASYAYNNSAEREHVMCQEVGHTFGLDHQDTSGASLNTCMDYYHNTSSTDTKSTTPNQHDYDELGTIYAHLDSSTTIGASLAHGAAAAVPWWANPSESVYVQHLGNGQTQVTYITWASPLAF